MINNFIIIEVVKDNYCVIMTHNPIPDIRLIKRLYYHSPCTDGLFCAVQHKWINPLIELIPFIYGTSKVDLKDEGLINEIVEFADVSPSLEELLVLSAKCKDVIICDHHEAAITSFLKVFGPNFETRPSNVHFFSDTTETYSAGTLVWQRITGKIDTFPQHIDLNNRYDTGKYKQMTADELAIHRGMSESKDVDSLMNIIDSWSDYQTNNILLPLGRKLNKERADSLAAIMQTVHIAKYNDITIAYIDVENALVMNSLVDSFDDYKDVDVIAGRYHPTDTTTIFSLRRRHSSNFKLDTFAQRFGCNGHAKAASIQLKEFVQFLP